MNRRKFLGAAAMMAAAVPGSTPCRRRAQAPDLVDSCGCDPFLAQARDASYAYDPNGPTLASDAFRDLSSGIKITNLKVFGVSLTPNSDRPYVFVKLETNQPGLIGWGEGTLEGKGQSSHVLRSGLSRLPRRQRSHAGRASVAVDVRAHLLPRRPTHRLCHLRHRSGTVGHSRQSPERARLSAPRRPIRSTRHSRLLSRREHQHRRGPRAPARDRSAARESPASRSACPSTTTSGSRRNAKLDRAVKYHAARARRPR